VLAVEAIDDDDDESDAPFPQGVAGALDS